MNWEKNYKLDNCIDQERNLCKESVMGTWNNKYIAYGIKLLAVNKIK